MLFNIESDSGDRIVGYSVPDGFSGQPNIGVRSDGTELLVFRTNESRPALVTAGRHETGLCGFTLDDRAVPGLANRADLELYDVDTQMLIYRRRQPRFQSKKLLRLETHLFPLWSLDHCFRDAFQYLSTSIDRFGRETITQMFLLDHVDSVYLSGRILFKNYSIYIEPHFHTITLLHDPYEELAERLLVLRNIKKIGSDKLGMRDALGMKAAIDFAAELPMQDEKSLGRALRRMTPEVASILANPLVRQLTASTPDEMPGGGSVSYALNLLASFAIVGLRREPETFLGALAELLGVDPASMPVIPTLPSVAPFADMLKRSREVDLLIEKDSEVYSHVAAAFKKVA